MDLFTVLVRNNWALGGTGISTKNNPVLPRKLVKDTSMTMGYFVDETDDGGASFGGLGGLHAFL